MDVDRMIAELRAEQREIDSAIAALVRITGGKRRGVVEVEEAGPSVPVGKPGKKRHMSAEGRKRVGDAARKRWAAIRAAKAGGQDESDD